MVQRNKNIGGWKIKTKQYIKLPGISNQKIRQKYYTPESITHPAKADIPMMHWILKKFVQDGDIVLDPMCGIGTTMIEGMRLFPNSIFIGVELEEKFLKMAEANIKSLEARAKIDMFLKIGKAVCVQGDARELEKIMKEKVSKIISSPPFGKENPIMPMKNAKKFYKKAVELRQSGEMKSSTKGINPKSQLKNYLDACKRQEKGRITNPENIGNLKYGQADKIITSPPFGGKVQHKTNYLGKQKRESGFEYSDNPENIGNMPHGQIDKVITSPPYEEGIGHGGRKERDIIEKKRLHLHGKDSYSKSKINIGFLTGKTYLGEMLRVYRECLKILKPGSLMILITKDFIRNKKRVTLGEDTLKLCQAAGFTFREIYHRKIEHPSFWRVLYQQKHPEVEKIDSEDILVFQKN